VSTTESKPTLYVIRGSHACRTAMLMLDHKGIGYRRVDLPPGLHPFGVRLRGFPGYPEHVRKLAGRSHRPLAMLDRLGTVPALRAGSERIQTNRAIARFLDRVQPQPPLFPTDPKRRATVEEAERWGDDELQMTARRLGFAAIQRGREAMHRRANDGRLGPMLWRSETVRFAAASGIGRIVFDANPDSERELLAALPPMLDRIDGLIGAGVLDSEQLNAADFMIVTSLALLCYRVDLRPEIEARPAGWLLERVLPEPAT
jgi:glutathione S-transferase